MNKITNHQLYRLISAHFAEIIREPAVIFWGVVFPILMAWGLGIAFTQKGEVHIKLAIVRSSTGNNATPETKLLGYLMANGIKKDSSYTIDLKNEKIGNVSLIFFETSWSNAYTMLKKGKVAIIIEDKLTDIKYHFDPANAEAKTAWQLVANLAEKGTAFYAANQSSIEPLTMKGTRYVDFLIPGLLAMGIMMACSWGISYTIIDRRSKKLLRRMVATPMKKSNFLLALITARFSMNVVEAVLLFLFAWLYFGTKVQGSWPALIILFLAGNIAFSGISILMSSHTANPEVGNGIINALVTPMMVVSGVFFSYHNFPDWTIPIIRYLPLTMIADSFRSIFNEGAGMMDLWREALILTTVGTVSFIVGLKIFKWY
ncbi:MAG TPA: ABC transporter permease [Prolixibacteraceae bacterium]|jgi:ABC-type multidrug transport system permease subunit